MKGNQQALADTNLKLFATVSRHVNWKNMIILQASQVHRRTLRNNGRQRKHAWLLADTKQPKQTEKGGDGKMTSKK